jgi:signal transduction histidine kinase/class 3 adenylate cyclase/AmiR/NasT family two-component response regulator
MSLTPIKKLFCNLSAQVPLRVVLVVPFVLQIVGAVGIVGYLSFTNGEKAVNDLAGQLRKEISDRIEDKLNNYLALPHQVNQLNVEAIALGQININDFNTTGKYFWKQAKIFGFGFVNFANPKGEFIGAGIEKNQILIEELSPKTPPGKAHHFFTDTEGNRIKLADTTAYNPLEEDWYKDPVQKGKFMWSSIYNWSDYPDILALSSSYPIYDKNKQLLGVIGIDLLLSEISDFLGQLKISPNGRTFIIEHDGNLVATSTKDKAYTINKGVAERIKATAIKDSLIIATAKHLEQKFNLKNLGEKPQLITFKIQDKKQFVQVTPWRDRYGLNWLIVIVIPEADFMEQIHANNRTTILLSVTALIIAIFIGIATTKYIVSPILKLKKAAIAISQGDLNQKLDLHRKDELGILANTFNNMALQLQESFTNLEIKNKELQELNQLKDEFLANTSHELKTPLNGIIGITESLIDGVTGELSPQTKNNLLIVISSAKRLANLVNDILDFSKLRHHNIELQIKPTSIKELVDLVMMLSTPLINNKKINIINHIQEDLPLVEADENRLQQILYNLLGNAIKFTEQGQIDITATVILPPEIPSETNISNRLTNLINRAKVKITIADTGIGIAADQLDKIFESFEQGDGSTAREYGGTGLGLAITKQLVELHQGDIFVTSQIGIGSQFSFTLPVSDSPVQKTAETSLIRKIEKTLKTIDENLELNQNLTQELIDIAGEFNILIVDDEPINRQVLVNHLSLESYNIIQATNGIEALEMINNGLKPDLILLDIMMPKMTGYQVCKQLRLTYPPSELPIILLTAKNQVSDLVEGFNAGANDYLTKPFAKNELLARIRTHLYLAKLNAAYSRFVPQQFLRFLEKENILDVQLGDQIQKEMTIMFTDIRSFTTLSESMSPQENFKFINDYLSRVSPIIRNNNGFIDKYIGDAIMALFPDSSEDALKAAISMQNQVNIYNIHRLTLGEQPIAIGIGIHTGTLMLGTIGEAERMESTVISDAVNLASRLEGLTKMYNAGIIISQETLFLMEDPTKYNYRFLDRVKVKGKNQAVAVFEVYHGDPEEIKQLKNQTRTKFEQAVIFYYQQNFSEAQILFNEVLQINPQDQATLLYLKRCDKYQNYTEGEDWEIVESMTEK